MICFISDKVAAAMPGTGGAAEPVVKARTRHSSGNKKLKEYVGKGKEFDVTEVPTLRAVIQRGLLIKENWMLGQADCKKNEITLQDICKELASDISKQWLKSNNKFSPPVVIEQHSIVIKVRRLWERVEKVAQGNAKKAEKVKIDSMLDKLVDITNCSHQIRLCKEAGSGCPDHENCKAKAHIECSCIARNKIPVLDLEWLYYQREKVGEKSNMKMGPVDWAETEKQVKALKNKSAKEAAKAKQALKLLEKKKYDIEEQEQVKAFIADSNNVEEAENEDDISVEYVDQNRNRKDAAKEVEKMVDFLLKEKLGDLSHLVVRYLDRPKPRRNNMPIPNTAKASLRCQVSPAVTATIVSEYLKDLIAAGHLSPDMSYLACDPSKLYRARKAVMVDSTDTEKKKVVKIVGLGYDGRKDKNTRAMVEDKNGNIKMRMISEEHISMSEEPSGKFLGHFVPEAALHPEKPALKVAQSLYEFLKDHDSLDSLQILQGDSTNANTGWKGGSHAHLEKLLGRKLFWGICNIHTHELPLRHLIAKVDGPTSSDKGFTGPVCSLLSKVNEMDFNPSFKALPGGEALIVIPDNVVETMSTDQKQCYKLVQAVKSGVLPPALQEMMCGKLSHARWLTTGQRLVFMWTRKHGLTGSNLKVLEMLVKFCLEYYFKIYFDIKVKHLIVDAPSHILTSLRILKKQPKAVRDVVTFYIRTGAWYAHSECVLLSLLASSSIQDRSFAVKKILELRGVKEFGDTSVRPRKTPKLNLSATSLPELIDWKSGEVDEPVFTCSMSQSEVKGFIEKPFSPPKFSSHTQSTERCVKLMTEAASAVCGREARDAYTIARIQHREVMPVFTTKKHIMATF